MENLKDERTRAQRWADIVTTFSGSWPFIIWFTVVCIVWVLLNVSHMSSFDPYPFLFLNWILTVVSTLQNPLIMLSQNRQNETDRENIQAILSKLDEALDRIKQLEKEKEDNNGKSI
jgi:uncharacterized membrane protein